MFCKKGAFKNFAKFTGKHFRNTFFYRTPPAAAFDIIYIIYIYILFCQEILFSQVQQIDGSMQEFKVTFSSKHEILVLVI